MDYTLRELECFIAVAEELSFTRAAQRLHLAQPPLSRHIRTLEERFGAKLFERHPRRIVLTSTGRAFYEASREILPQVNRAGELARRAASGKEARLQLGFVSAVLGPKVVDLLRRLRESRPRIALILHDLAPSEQLIRIAAGHLDAGFIGIAPLRHPPGLRFLPWYSESLKLFVPSGHPLEGRKKVRLQEIRDEAFLAVSHTAAPAFSLMIHDLCRKAGFRPRIVEESARAQAIAAMVAAGCGVALLPESLEAVTGNSSVALALSGNPSITHMVALNSAAPSTVMESLIRPRTTARG